MSFRVLMLVAGLAVGWARRGSLWNIVNLRLRYLWVLPAAYVLQHVSIAYLQGTLYELLIVFSYVGLIAFCLANFRVPGVMWAAGGTACNFLAMIVNGLRMPAYLPAARDMAPNLVPLLEKGEYGKSIAMGSSTHLNFLGDIFYFKIWPPSLISIGDILFAIGIVILIQHAMRTGKGESHAVNLAEPAEHN